MSKETFKRKLTITSQRELTTLQRGKDTTILYEVEAITETGEKVTQKLRTFHPDLPTGELIEFNVTPYDHPDHGRSYTIALPSKGRASKKDITELQNQVIDMANRVSALESEVAELRREVKKDKPREPEF